MTDQPDAFADQSARYHDFVDSTQRWLGKRADRYHWFYNGSRIALVVLSVSISSLSMGLLGEKAKGATPFVALTIAIVAALDGLLKPGDNWRHFRSYQLGLMRLRRVWEAKRIALTELEPNADKRRQKAVDLHRQFVLEVEALLEQESKLFFEHQIQQLKQKAE
jgi:hypothetical protein